jgi:asparagine synthase (glutamine-hydrolysing)
MCGINGIYAYHYASNPIDRAELLRTRDYMAARGPEGEGEWVSGDAHAALGYRPPAGIELSDPGGQPVANLDGTLIVTFSGQIHNCRSLQSQLEKEGFVFRTASDTEVLLHLYAQREERMVDDLRGTFALAIWDSLHRRLLLARDPNGIKPLYYADDGWTFRFASEADALLATGKVPPGPPPPGRTGFCLWRAAPKSFTACQDIRAIPAGSILWVDSVGPHEPTRYVS